MKSKIIIGLLAITIAFSSCNKWLDVTSKTEIPNSVHFDNVTGYKDAVVGVYVKLSTKELYAKNMSWYTNEFVSQNYAVVAGATILNFAKYAYDVTPFVGVNEQMWNNSYQAIANMNNILINQEKTGHVMSPIVDSLVKGEMLAMRAYVHLDLLRMYGKGNLARRSELMDQPSIPYSTDFSKKTPPTSTYKEFFAHLKQDLESAIDYLEVDPFNKKKSLTYYAQDTIGRFIDRNLFNRRYRMNCYAAKALYARALLWEGTKDSKAKALKLSEELIEECFETKAVTWASSNAVNGAEWWKSDLLFRSEHLLTIAVEKLSEYQETKQNGMNNWFDAGNPSGMYDVAYLTKAKVNEIYEIPGVGESDWRFTNCLLAEGPSLNNYSLVKLRQHKEHTDIYSRMIPLIRISEIFYIAAECRMEPGADYDREKALSYLNMVRNKRNIPESENLTMALNDSEIFEEITKEYRKEFVGEGQTFFYFKRLGFETIPGFLDIMDDTKYQYPLIDDEIILGGRS